jgi:protease I
MLEGKNILMVIAPQNFRDEEFLEPKKIFEDAGAKVVVASPSLSVATGMLGAKVTPNITISEVNINEYDAIVVVGGIGSKQYLWENEELRGLVKKASNQGKIVSAICLSPAILARAGLLEGKNATVFPSGDAIEELNKGGAVYISRDVVVSGNIVTANGPDAAREFGNKVVEKLK